MNSEAPIPEPPSGKGRLIRDVIVFQWKLLLDAVRDVLLSPVSIMAGLIDLASGAPRDRMLFYRLLRLGRRTDHWIGLFHAPEPSPAGTGDDSPVDLAIDEMEARVREQFRQGGLSAASREALEGSLEMLRRRGSDRRE